MESRREDPEPRNSEPPEPSRRGVGELGVPAGRLVRLALLFYGGLFAAAVLWAGLAGDSLFYATGSDELRGVDAPRDLAAGALAAGILIELSRELARRTRWGENLARALGTLLGKLSLRQCLVLAAASGVAEEAFFRGALQPRVGLLAASLLFGLAHFAPRRELAPWALFATAAGFLLGVVFTATGNLLAPVTAHFLVNAVNLRVIAVRYA